ncbi:MAG: hypothetical protein GYA21_13780 [Myxococcales bacterium]|nr:hypothetical protein [Myxococcales bacterium]
MAPARAQKTALAEKLAQALRRGAPEEAPDTADAREHFARALEILRGGGDPRRVMELPALFQEAFLLLWEEAREPEPLLDLLNLTRDAAVQKAARRALHRLRSAGMDLPDPAAPRPSVLARAGAPAEKVLPCHVSEPSSQGVESLLLSRYVHGGVATAQAFLDDESGLVEFDGGVVGRNRHREILRSVQAEGEARWLEISYEEARQRLTEGARQAREKGRPLPEKYLELSAHFPEVAPVEVPRGRELFQRDELSGVPLSDTASLLDREEFAHWGPPRRFVEVMIQKLDEIRQSQVIISDEQRLEQVRRLLESAPQRLLEEPEERRRFQERLFRMAAFLERRGAKEAARLAAAAAWPLLDPDFKPESHPFFARLATKGFLSPEEIVAHMRKDAAKDKDGAGEPTQNLPPASPGGRIILP